MKRPITVIFKPEGHKVRTASGTSIFEAACKAGVGIRSECGGMHAYINPESAKLIGLVPDVPTEKTKFVGNAALTGAKMALISSEARKTAETLSKRIRYLELTVDPDFCSEFADAMFIPHKDSNKFSSVREYFRRIGRDV